MSNNQLTVEATKAMLPIVNVTAESVQVMPLGSDLLAVDFQEQSVTNVQWNEETRDAVVKQLSQEDDWGNLTFVYIPPVTIDQATDVADRIMREHDRDKLDGFENLTLRELRAMLIEATMAGRNVKS